MSVVDAWSRWVQRFADLGAEVVDDGDGNITIGDLPAYRRRGKPRTPEVQAAIDRVRAELEDGGLTGREAARKRRRVHPPP